MLTPDGLRLYLASIAATRSKALLWFGTSQRDASNQWLGNCCRSFVELGNAHCSVTGLLMLLCCLTDYEDVLEQSDSSCLPKVPPLNAVLIYMKATRALTYHCDFGGDSLKPLQLWASSSIVFESCVSVCWIGRLETNQPGLFFNTCNLLFVSLKGVLEWGCNV